MPLQRNRGKRLSLFSLPPSLEEGEGRQMKEEKSKFCTKRALSTYYVNVYIWTWDRMDRMGLEQTAAAA